MTATTQASPLRRRNLTDWRNRPTKQLMRDYNRLRGKQTTEGLDDQERNDLHHIGIVLRKRDRD